MLGCFLFLFLFLCFFGGGGVFVLFCLFVCFLFVFLPMNDMVSFHSTERVCFCSLIVAGYFNMIP